MKPVTICAALCIATLAGAMPALSTAQDLERGREKASECIACHGPAGITANPTFPNIAGQNAAYLGMQLENFRSGERYHSLMTPIALSLSEQDMRDLAAYFSGEGVAAAQ